MNKHFAWIALFLFLSSCATYEAKYADRRQAEDIHLEKDIEHTFYLIGDAGLSPMGDLNPVLKRFRDRLTQADGNSTALFLGDNIYPAGLPDPQDSTVAFLQAANHLNAQIATVRNFKGRPIFIPGNHDWYTEGLIGLKRQENYIEDALNKKDVFLPEDGCPIEIEEVTDNILLITLDTEWYLTNWDKRPSINDDCEIKSREKFWSELESEIKKNADKTILLAVHHPMFSYGAHGGQYTFRQQFYPSSSKGPLPVLGTFINLFRKTAGASIEDMQNKRYRELRNRLTTLAQYADKLIVASGHEHTLQYIVENNVPQIVSGSGAKKGATNLLNGSQFSTGRRGYATLEVYGDGSSRVRYYGVSDEGSEEFMFGTAVIGQDPEIDLDALPEQFPDSVAASVYSEEEVNKSPLFTVLWGKRYRKYYGTQVKVPVVQLDTLLGGLTPVRMGGGQQSKSLRLRHPNGKQYVMRALKKQAERNLQAMAFKDQYVIGEFEETFTEKLLEDFYTGAHPYAPFALEVLSDAADIYHTNPRLFYIPKQKALGKYNQDFGDELYLFEEHVSDGHNSLASFGYADDIESTYDFLNKLREDEKYRVDQSRYIRARLFDMLIGDWDRHQDQWRWAETKIDSLDQVLFRPIPRDRDQVFSIMGDGLLMSLATRLIPPVKKMEGFGSRIRNVRTFNTNPFSLDMALLNESVPEDWEKEVAFLQKAITPEVIDRSFAAFPPEVRDETLEDIKSKILSRLELLPEIARTYYRILNRNAVVKGTDKDDWFEVYSNNRGEVEVSAFRNLKGEKQKRFFHKTFDPEITKEVWIYGLDDQDRFEVNTRESNKIRIKIIGGNGKDIYEVVDGKKVAVYDFKTKADSLMVSGGVKVRKTDDYELNSYQPLKLINHTNQLVPTLGFNPDDGVRLGFSNTFTRYGFRRNPFTSQHRLNASFYFATSGFDLDYSGEFAHLFENWNFKIDARFTSPNFSRNFFGFGNSSQNNDDDLGLDYNRVRLQTLSVSPSLVWRGQLGASFQFGISYENITVEETNDRFINTFYQQNGEENTKGFYGAQARYHYQNFDNAAFPTLGMSSELTAGFKVNADDTSTHYAYVIPALSLDHRLVPSGRLVLATKWKAHFNIGNGFEFYQAAQLGAADGLRGFRNERFSGKTSYYQLTDIRYQLKKMRTGLLPISVGLYGAFDYGRVWYPGLSSERWHNAYGGGIFLNGADVMSANLALFNSEDGLRFSFGLGFGF